MQEFMNWDILTTYATFVTIVFMVVAFIKELKYVKKIKTKYVSFFVALILLTITNLALNTFHFFDITLYILSSISISLGANGLNDFNRKGGIL